MAVRTLAQVGDAVSRVVSHPSSRPPVLELTAAARRFGPSTALSPISLQLHAGAVCVVAGGNGAGKTTLLRMAAGLLAPSAGTRTGPERSVYLRPSSGLRASQRVQDALATTLALAGQPRAAVLPSLDRVGLTAFAGSRVGALSTGQRSRLPLALLLCLRPQLACLDEPSASMDADGRELVREVVAELAAGGTALLVATHDADLLPDADAVVRLADGRLVP